MELINYGQNCHNATALNNNGLLKKALNNHPRDLKNRDSFSTLRLALYIQRNIQTNICHKHNYCSDWHYVP
jgi:hypothetical protein